MYYRDVYKRPVNVSDIVLCIPYRCANGVSDTQYLTIVEVGHENDPVKVTDVILYFLTEVKVQS